MPEDWKNAGLKTTQHGLFGNPALGKYWTEHKLGYFYPDGWVKHLMSLKIKITHRINIGNSNNQNMDIYY